jgi:hypothetical protein
MPFVSNSSLIIQVNDNERLKGFDSLIFDGEIGEN